MNKLLMLICLAGVGCVTNDIKQSPVPETYQTAPVQMQLKQSNPPSFWPPHEHIVPGPVTPWPFPSRIPHTIKG